MPFRLSIAALGLSALMASAHAQEFYAPQPLEALLGSDGPYDQAVPKPQEITGHQVGDFIVTPDRLHAYVRAVAAASGRVSLREIARSWEKRPIYAVTITSVENQARLDDIRSARLALTDPAADAAPGEHPMVFQATFGVHGTEASGYDSSQLALYHYAAAQDPATTKLLDESILVFYVMLNPDGGTRFSTDVNAFSAINPTGARDHMERIGRWPSGRTNHYWFDLNRQWLPLSQPEIRGVVRESRRWVPNVAVDLHEMGEERTFFFSPGPPDGLHPLLTQESLDLTFDMGEELAATLDAMGVPHVSGENYDDFYLGYGSSYPGLHGAVPFLFEQSSSRGRIYTSAFGEERYDDKVKEQFRVLQSLIAAAHKRRVALNDYLQRYHRDDVDAPSDPADARGWVFTSTDPDRLGAFLRMLTDHGLEVHRLGRDLRTDGRAYAQGDAFIVRANQTLGRLARGVFDRRDVTEKTEFYDVSGWTLPDAFGLDWRKIGDRVWSPGLLGERVDGPPQRNATNLDDEAFAWILQPEALSQLRVVDDLLAAGVRLYASADDAVVRTANGPASVKRGAIIVLASALADAQDGRDVLDDAARSGLSIISARSSRADEGADLGSFSLIPLQRSRPLMMVGDDFSAYSAGSLWHLLDRWLGVPLAMLPTGDIDRAALVGYTHLIIPHGRPSLDDAQKNAVSDWIESGGVLMAVRGGADWAVREDLTEADFGENDDDDTGDDVFQEWLAYAERSGDLAARRISGAVFATERDLTHPLAYGVTLKRGATHKIGPRAFVSADAYNQPVRYIGGDGLLSGYAPDEAREALAGKAAIIAERRGSGAVILFADEPFFRGYWHATARFFANGLFFGRAYRSGD